jgi:hypothetical protein
MRHRHWHWILVAVLATSVAACGSSASSLESSSTTATTAIASPITAAPTTSVAAPSATSGSSPSGSAADAYPLLAAFQGHFTGSWNNDTFATTGSMTWDITDDPSARTVTIVVSVGGNFFGGSGGPAETIVLTHLASGVIAGHSTSFGDVSGTITPGGALQIDLANVPGGVVSSVAITGTFVGGSSISMHYTITLVAGGSAAGTVVLNRA